LPGAALVRAPQRRGRRGGPDGHGLDRDGIRGIGMETTAATVEAQAVAGQGGGEVELEALGKRFEGVGAVDSIGLDIAPGGVFSLLGPSGCGKTTPRRLIAGFERPTSGDVRLDGVSLAQVPPDRRNVNTVFQSYALFPHLNVLDNVAFGMRYQKVPRKERERRARAALAPGELGDPPKRPPPHLPRRPQPTAAPPPPPRP